MALYTHTFTSATPDIAAALAAAMAPTPDLGESVKLEQRSRGGVGQDGGGGSGGRGGGGGGYAAWNAISLSDLSQCAIELDTGQIKFVREDTESYNLFDGQSGAAGGAGGYHDESVEAPDVTYAGGNGGVGQAGGMGGGGGEGASSAGAGNNGTSGASGGAGGTGTAGADGGQGGDLFITPNGAAGTSPGGGGGGGAATPGTGGAGGGFEVKLTYTVLDTTAPQVESVTVVDAQTVEVLFDEDMDETTAETAANYAISGAGKGTLATNPNSASLGMDVRTVTLVWSSGEMLDGGDITITVSNVEDVAGNPIDSGANAGTDVGGGVGESPSCEISDPTEDPTYMTAAEEIAVVARCTDNESVEEVTWENDRGGSGVMENTEGTDWEASAIGLFEGENVITVTAIDAAENEGQDVLTITLDTSNLRDGAPGADITIDGANTGHISKTLALPDLPENYLISAGTPNSNLTLSATSRTITYIHVPITEIPGTAVVRGLELRITVATVVVAGTGFKVFVLGPTPITSRDIYLGILNGAEGSNAVTLTPGQKTITLNQEAIDKLQAEIDAGRPTFTIGLVALSSTTLATIVDSMTLGVAFDAVPPLVDITEPTARAIYQTDTNSVTIEGSVDDEYEIDTVTWRNSRGGNGDITPVDGDWTVEDIPLQIGLNVITVTATDTSGIVSKKQLFVTYTPPGMLRPADWGMRTRARGRRIRGGR